jgi:hypothetical protein
MILMSALFAFGVGIACAPAASAAPIGGLGDAAQSSSLVQKAAVIVVEGRRHCRAVRVCRLTPYGRRCHVERVCHR